jgi:hypothetical protein
VSGAWLQNLGVAVIVLAAAGFLLRRQLTRRARPPGCDTCPNCAVQPPAPTLIELGEPDARGRDETSFPV